VRSTIPPLAPFIQSGAARVHGHWPIGWMTCSPPSPWRCGTGWFFLNVDARMRGGLVADLEPGALLVITARGLRRGRLLRPAPPSAR
jgi:hypothetical protein